MESNKDYPRFYIFACLTLVPVVYFGYFAKEYFLMEKAREYKIKNKVNVGCLFLEKKYQTKHGIDKFEVNIDGNKYLLSDVVVKGFSFKKNIIIFKKKLVMKKLVIGFPM